MQSSCQTIIFKRIKNIVTKINRNCELSQKEKVILSPFLLWIYRAITDRSAVNGNCVSIDDTTYFHGSISEIFV